MKIYTGYGDKGKTMLFGGRQVKKSHPRVEVYGTLDELNSILGIVLTYPVNDSVQSALTTIQNEIFEISAELATPADLKTTGKRSSVSVEQVHRLEKEIDAATTQLPELKNFILPGGSAASAYLHLARTVCRRAERRLVELMKNDKISEMILVYLNRLSDLLFTLARLVNMQSGIGDVIWKNKKDSKK